jgi:hypothetical protein
MIEHELSPEVMAEARLIFAGTMEGVSACWYCGGIHVRVANLMAQMQPCPRVRKIEWNPNGETVQSVEFWPNGQWEDSVVFPQDVWADDEAGE